MKEFAIFFGMVAGASYLVIALGSFILKHIVALRSPPAKRALWTVLPPYALVAIAISLWIGTVEIPEARTFALVVPIAAAIPAFFAWRYWLKEFRQTWFENEDEIPSDAELENDDWKIGLLGVFASTVILIAAAFLKYLARN